MHWPVYALACICIGLDNVTGYRVVSDYAIAYANVYAIGYVGWLVILTIAYKKTLQDLDFNQKHVNFVTKAP